MCVCTLALDAGAAVFLPALYELSHRCELEIALKKEHFALLEPMQNELHKFFISSSCVLKAGDEEVIVVKKSGYEKCSRCWHRCEDLNEEKICTRCETNMFGEGEIRGFF